MNPNQNNIISPPNYLIRLFRWFCHPDLVVYIEGDLFELYEENVKSYGKIKAQWLFAKEVIKLMRPDLMKNMDGSHRMNTLGLFKNNLKISLRVMKRKKLLTSINILGLAVAFLLSTLVFIWVQSELGFDKKHTHAEHIYRVVSNISLSGQDFSSAMAPPPLTETLKAEFPEVEDATRTWNWQNISIAHFDNKDYPKIYNEDFVFEADSNFFQFFDFKLLKGNPDKILNKKRTVVLSESTAKKYFGEDVLSRDSIIGSNIQATLWGRSFNWEITGIAEDAPRKSHFHYNILLSLCSDPWSTSKAWTDNTYYTYVRLRPGSDPRTLEQKFPGLIETHAAAQIEANYQIKLEDVKKAGGDWSYLLQPLTSIHLFSDFAREIEANGNFKNLMTISLIGFMIFFIATINFVNLTIVSLFDRTRETGVKKAIGATRITLIWQVIQESMLTILIAMSIAIAFTFLLIHPINQYLELNLNLSDIELIKLITFWSILCLVVVIIGGAYPAAFLASISAYAALKGVFKISKSNMNLRSGLVVLQFSVSILLIISALVVHDQLEYVRDKSLGFNKDQTIVIDDPSMRMIKKYDQFFDELGKNPGINAAGLCENFPGSGDYYHPVVLKKDSGNSDFIIRRVKVGYGFTEAFGLHTTLGRTFDRAFNDHQIKNRIILNNKAVDAMGLENPIGQSIFLRELNTLKVWEKKYTIVGVLDDFNYESLHSQVEPLAMVLAPHAEQMVVSFNGRERDKVLRDIERTWREFLPDAPFQFKFVDERLEKLYRQEASMAKLLLLITYSVIFIACLGLYGLTSFLVEKRIKEIGIRKVLGGSVSNIVIMLFMDFGKWIVMAFVIGAPVAYVSMRSWLDNFSYQIEIDWWIFITTGLLTLLIALVTVSYSSIKVATTNPVRSLRSE